MAETRLTETQKRRIRRKRNERQEPTTEPEESQQAQQEGQEAQQEEAQAVQMDVDVPTALENEVHESQLHLEELSPNGKKSWLTLPIWFAKTLVGKMSDAFTGPSAHDKIKELEKKMLEMASELETLRGPSRPTVLVAPASPMPCSVPMAPSLDDLTIPAPPPLSPVPDAPEAPPIISRPVVRPAPATTTPMLDLNQLGAIKLRKLSEGDQRPPSLGGRAVITLEDLKQIKLRASTPRALPDYPPTISSRPGVIDFSQMSKIKLKARHDRSPGGTPMKQSVDHRQDPKLQTNGVNLNLLEVRRRLQNSPRAALLSGKGRSEENLKTPANTHDCWTPSTARAPPPIPAVGEVPPLASLLSSSSPTRRPFSHTNSSPVKAELILKPKALLTSNSNSNKAPLGHPAQNRSDKENSLESRIKHRMKQARERSHSTATEDLAIKAQLFGVAQKRHRPLSGQR